MSGSHVDRLVAGFTIMFVAIFVSVLLLLVYAVWDAVLYQYAAELRGLAAVAVVLVVLMYAAGFVAEKVMALRRKHDRTIRDWKFRVRSVIDDD